MKRSRAVALFSMGASVLALTACSDKSALVPAKVYASIAECTADGTFNAKQCETGMFAAEDAYEEAYPKFDTQEQCEVVAGAGNCEPDRPSSREYHYRPSMIGFLMPVGGSAVTPQAVVRSASTPSGYATAIGAAVSRTGTSGMIAAAAAGKPRASQVARSSTVSRGGFGSSAVAHASSGSFRAGS
jgi:uncharacterized protein YgiB involved in biofilm formation